MDEGDIRLRTGGGIALPWTVTRLGRLRRVALGLSFVALAPFPLFAESQGHHSKTDLAVDRSVRGGAMTVKVLITIDDPSLRLQIRQSLEAHGDTVKSEHPLVGAIAAEVHASDVAQLID